MRFLFVHGWAGFSLAEWYLRDALQTCSVPVTFRTYDMPVSGVPINDTLPRLLVTYQPDVIGFSCHYWSYPAFCEAVRWVRHLRPGTKVVFGGPQVNGHAAAAAALRDNPGIDFVFRGAVQRSLGALLEHLSGRRAGLDEVAGLSYRDRGMIRHTPGAGDEPRRTGRIFQNDNRELTDYLSTAREASYETVIGCRAKCAYCVYPTGQFELIDDDLVCAELGYLCSLGIPNIRICDAHFAGQRGRAKKLLRHLVKVNRVSSIKVYPDTNHVDPEYVSLLKDANAEVTSVGVQTTNAATLERIHRHPADRRRGEIELLLQAFPNTPADVIVGLPGDGPDDLLRTFEDVMDLGFRRVNPFRLHLFPGTSLGDVPSDYLQTDSLTTTASGQLLSSSDIGPDTHERVANLVHAAEVVMPLVRVRRRLREAAQLEHLMGLASALPSQELLELRSRITSFFPITLVRELESTVTALIGALPEQPDLADLLRLDLLELLCSSASERRLQHFQWDADAAGRRVRTVEVPLDSGRLAVWQVERGRVFTTDLRPQSDDPSVLRVAAAAGEERQKQAC